MKKLFIPLMVVLGMSLGSNVKANPDEGMWLPIFVKDLNYDQMKEMGLKLTAEEIYSINNSSLKDAIVNFGNFCTGEVVSDQGLVFTNHHCGYGAIQDHSTIDHDYLTDGFWAYSKEEELSNPGLTATFFVNMEDVTEKILGELNPEMNEDERSAKIKEVSVELEKSASKDGRYEAEVRSFFNGNEYYLFLYEVFRDIRLVGAPPSAIGKYGGDTDNWMWPRHTGDFSVFRIYTAPDGSPAEYSKDNVPFKPKWHLPISLDGIKKDDFSMIWGYPGSTDRYRTSQGIQLTLDQINPAIDKVGDVVLSNMKENMDRDDEVRIKYAASYSGIANLWKNKKGESRGLKRLKVYDKKKAIEDDLESWVAQSPDRKQKYGELIPNLDNAYKAISDSKLNEANWYIGLGMYGISVLTKPFGFQEFNSLFEKKMKSSELKETFSKFTEQVEATYKDYDVETEKQMLKEYLKIYRSDIPAQYQPDAFQVIDKKYKGNISKYVDKLFDESIFASKENMMEFLAKPSKKEFENDLLAELSMSFGMMRHQANQTIKAESDVLAENKRLFIAALREMNPEKAYYPDANFTMRLSYGSVLDYYPADAIHYDFVTTIDGVMEKEDPSNEEFIVPQKLKELYAKKDYGQYADKNGQLITCFLSDNDITGGNSGSPVINGNGELIGIAFDGNWEAMSGDIAFEPELQRTISVDIRYVLFVIDKYAGAKNLIKELDIHTQPVPKPFITVDQDAKVIIENN
ncbi:MAG: S46 family peptidase [Bacteroidales bacterium]|nr:S46 family peptidase [Bacteroidales bacterium]